VLQILITWSLFSQSLKLLKFKGIRLWRDES
jgi:hypothetical protein